MEIIRVALKDFNPSRLMEEIAAFPVTGVSFAGFVVVDDRRVTPAPSSTVVGETTVGKEHTYDVAESGELRFQFRDEPLSLDALDAVIIKHDASLLTDEQARQDRDEADMDALLADLAAWDLLDETGRSAAMRRLLRIVLRRERGAAI